ncbi:MAG: competence/damage-inducible protein A [Oscillospiraceae bacterium]
MKAEIICVGTELLLGDILNTNAQYLSRALSELGISVYNQQVVGDNGARLKQAVELAKGRSDIVILSGGLGPTDDDLTKQTVAGIYNDTLIFNKEISDEIREYFKSMSRPMTPNNEKQAYVPKNGKFFPNERGTAPGIVFKDKEKMAILLPGPPKELQPMMEKSVIPMLKKLVNGVISSRYVKVIGIGESALETKIMPLLQGENPSMALYAKEGEVTVRITASAKTKEQADSLIDELYIKLDSEINPYIYGVDVENIETVLVNKLIQNNQTVASAESCTGGTLSGRITSVSGASQAFKLGVCTYSDEQKMRVLGVNKEDLDSYTAVSSIVASQMAQGILKMAKSNYSIATTGYAGPGGGTPQEPVGTVYIAVATKDCVYTKKCFFSGDRGKITHLAAQNALDLLRCVLFGLPLAGAKMTQLAPPEEENPVKEKKPKKKRYFLKFLMTFTSMLLISALIAYGFLWYKNGGVMPVIDFSKLSLPFGDIFNGKG